jgi:hypothetical protein
MMEAVAFFLFGVNVLAARLLIAAATALSAIVLFRLVASTHKSTLIAALTAITFLSLPESQWVGGDVMLEYPTMVSVLLALYCLHGADEVYSLRRAMIFALLAGAAVWTKQQAVFLIGVPFLYFAIIGRWKVFRQAPIWVSSGVAGIIVAALAALSLPFHGAGVAQVTSFVANGRHITHLDILRRNFLYYTREYSSVTGPAGLILLGLAVMALIFGRVKRKQVALYISWIVVSMGVLLLIRPLSTRYLFFTLPAVIVMGYDGLLWLGERFASRRAAVVAAVAVCVLAAVWKVPPTPYLHGPDDAARMLAKLKPSRILYCGGSDGQFIFNYRSARAGLDTTIISGDNLPPAVFTPDGLETFAHDYGVQYIVMEDAQGLVRGRPWTPMIHNLPPSMIPEREILLSGSGRWNGVLRVYRFANPSRTPKDHLSMRMQMIGGTMGFELHGRPAK